MLISGNAAHLLWYAIGAVVGVAIVAVGGRSFVTQYGARRAMPGLVVSAVVLAVVLAWAMNAWNDYVHASATMPGGM